jgi:hypothetical protein
MKSIIPHSRHRSEGIEVFSLGQYFGLKPTHLTGGGCLMLTSSASDSVPHGWIDAKTVGIIGILVACQTAENRLPQKCHHRVLRVLAGTPIGQFMVGYYGQIQGVVEFSVGKQPSIGGHS